MLKKISVVALVGGAGVVGLSQVRSVTDKGITQTNQEPVKCKPSEVSWTFLLFHTQWGKGGGRHFTLSKSSISGHTALQKKIIIKLRYLVKRK